MIETDVVIVGSGMAGAAVWRSLRCSALRVLVLEDGPAITAGDTHLRNVLPDGDGWRSLVSAMTAPPVRAAGASPRARPDQHPEEALPGLANCRGIGGNALVWSGIVLPDSVPPDESASRWLGAECVRGSPRQDWLQETHGLEPVPLAWSRGTGWHGPRQLAGEDYRPLALHSVRRIVHDGSRASGVEVLRRDTNDRTFIATRHVVICAGVIGTVRLLWTSRLELPALGRGIAHHPVAVAQVAIPNDAWSHIARHPHIDRPAAVRAQPAPAGGHTLIVAEPPWMPDDRIDPRATLSIYAYATLAADANRHLTFAPEQLGPDGLALPRLTVPHSEAERDCERRALGEAQAWAARLGTQLAAGRPRVLPRGADQHLCGGARIGGADDPLAVAEPSGRLHGLENVWVAGAATLAVPVSTHPTQNIVALAARTGRAVASLLTR